VCVESNTTVGDTECVCDEGWTGMHYFWDARGKDCFTNTLALTICSYRLFPFVRERAIAFLQD
jgi:hypothetical protein